MPASVTPTYWPKPWGTSNIRCGPQTQSGGDGNPIFCPAVFGPNQVLRIEQPLAGQLWIAFEDTGPCVLPSC